MGTADLLRGQYRLAHDLLEQIIDGCDSGTVNDRLAGSTTESIAATYAHAVLVEDFLVNDSALKRPLLFDEGGWQAVTGVPRPDGPRMTPEWAASFRLDLPSFREYARALYASVDASIAALSEEQLAAERDTYFGRQSLAQILGGVPLNHVIHHGGEIAAQQGMRGRNGLPF